MGTFPLVHIILVNWNGWEDTAVCLATLQEVDYPNVEIVVVDNNSSDGSVANIRKRYPYATVLESGENLGFAGGNNLGITYALEEGAEYVWLLNNDTLIDENALKALVRRMQEDSGIGICGSKLIYFPQRETVQALGGGVFNKWLGISTELGKGEPIDHEVDHTSVEERLDYIVGASMLVSRPFLEEVGLMNEEYFLYYEEIDWAYRARGKYRLGFAPDSRVYHKEGATIKGDNRQPGQRSRLSDFYQIRNRLRFTWNFHPWLLPVTYLTLLGSILKRMVRNQWDRVPMILWVMITLGFCGQRYTPTAPEQSPDSNGHPPTRYYSGDFY